MRARLCGAERSAALPLEVGFADTFLLDT